ncbi:MAG: ATPase, T2SS/T4P/T4SS family [Candidatus Firestonebacteria bacterium]
MNRKKIGEILIKNKIISSEQLRTALEKQKSDNFSKRTGEILLYDMAVINEENFYKSLAEQYNLPYINLEKEPLEIQTINNYPFEILLKYQFIPHKTSDNKISQIIYDPTIIDTLDELEMYLKYPLNLLITKKEVVLKTLDKISSLKADVEKISEDFSTKIISEEEILEDKLVDDTQPIIKLVNSVIYNAIRKGASDIHLEIDDSKVIIKYRIDGVLQKVMDNIDKKFAPTLISRIKVMAELNLAEKRIPQDGRFKIRFQGRNIDFRISILPTLYGEVCVIRILDKSQIDLRLDRLGFDNDILEKFSKIVKQPYGMVLVTGPTGSGKTTTLYSVINYINTIEDKIITIEDPIEYLLYNTVQIPVNEKKGVTFSKGLRSILRHDPDKIMVGEIRDPETAQIAVQSALTGHLVFTTIHANNVVDVIGRLINMGVKPYEFITSLNCILAQRLVRKICPKCIKEVKHIFEGSGCENCNHMGYSGRTGIFELLVLSDRIKEMILQQESFIQVKKIAKSEGMISLREAGFKKILEGITTLKELNRVTLTEGEKD